MMTEETSIQHKSKPPEEQQKILVKSIDLCTKGLVDKIKSPVQGIDVSRNILFQYFIFILTFEFLLT